MEKRADTDGNTTVDLSYKFVYNGMNLSLTANSNGSTAEIFMSSPGADQFLANGTDWLLGDHQGTIRDRVSMATHADTHVQYNAFGEILGGAIGTSTATIGYTGQIWDANAGLYNFRNRWYDPKIGKFLSQDPSGFTAGDANLYRYVGNSPLSFTDPTGLEEKSNIKYQSAVGAGIAATAAVTGLEVGLTGAVGSLALTTGVVGAAALIGVGIYSLITGRRAPGV